MLKNIATYSVIVKSVAVSTGLNRDEEVPTEPVT